MPCPRRRRCVTYGVVGASPIASRFQSAEADAEERKKELLGLKLKSSGVGTGVGTGRDDGRSDALAQNDLTHMDPNPPFGSNLSSNTESQEIETVNSENSEVQRGNEQLVPGENAVDDVSGCDNSLAACLPPCLADVRTPNVGSAYVSPVRTSLFSPVRKRTTVLTSANPEMISKLNSMLASHTAGVADCSSLSATPTVTGRRASSYVSPVRTTDNSSVVVGTPYTPVSNGTLAIPTPVSALRRNSSVPFASPMHTTLLSTGAHPPPKNAVTTATAPAPAGDTVVTSRFLKRYENQEITGNESSSGHRTSAHTPMKSPMPPNFLQQIKALSGKTPNKAVKILTDATSGDIPPIGHPIEEESMVLSASKQPRSNPFSPMAGLMDAIKAKRIE